MQQLQLRNQDATTFTGGGNILRFSNASITRETGLGAAGTNPTATEPGGANMNAFFGTAGAQANQWEADFTEAVAGTLVTGLTFQDSIVADRNIWDPTFQFSVAAGGITYRVKTENPSDGIDYVNVRNGTAGAGAGAAVDQIVTNAQNLQAGVSALAVGAGGSVDDYLGRQILGIIIEGTQNDTLQMSTTVGGGQVDFGTAHPLTGGADTLNGAPSGIYVSAVGAGTVTLSTAGDAPITFTASAGNNMTLTFIMGARFAVSDADGNDAVPSAPLDNGTIVFLQDQDAVAHYLDFGRDSNSNALRLHDAIFGNSHHRAENKSQLLSLSELAVNPGVDLFVGTSTVNAATGLITPAAANAAGVHVVFLTDLGQATLAGGNGDTTGRCANVQLIDSQDNTNFEVKLLAEWLADGSTTAGGAGTFPRMQFTRVQDGMTSPSN
ncbi:MAG: hypothetical protein K0U52_07895 [Gammaproteobacteria bacterium]|nr:hypothetical protein [Gammaproteobacteria bacterium]